MCAAYISLFVDDRPFQLEGTVRENGEQLGKVKQQLEDRQSERNRIKYEVTIFIRCSFV